MKYLLKLARTSKKDSKKRDVFKLLLTAPSRLRTKELERLLPNYEYSKKRL